MYNFTRKYDKPMNKIHKIWIFIKKYSPYLAGNIYKEDTYLLWNF